MQDIYQAVVRGVSQHRIKCSGGPEVSVLPSLQGDIPHLYVLWGKKMFAGELEGTVRVLAEKAAGQTD